MGGVYCKKCGQPQDGGNIYQVHLLGDRRHCRHHSNQIIKLKKPYQINYLQRPEKELDQEVDCCARCDSQVESIKDGVLVCSGNCLHDWEYKCCTLWI